MGAHGRDAMSGGHMDDTGHMGAMPGMEAPGTTPMMGPGMQAMMSGPLGLPMTPEEAAGRMDLLGHGFFFFTSIDTHRSAVVYRRDDGDVGLIDEAD